MNDKEFEDLKDRLLPIELREEFEKNREICNKNAIQIENFAQDLKKIEGVKVEKVILGYILEWADSQIRSLNIAINHREMLYLTNMILRQRIEKIENTLHDKGIEVENLLKYNDALRFIDNYIKHSSEDKSLE